MVIFALAPACTARRSGRKTRTPCPAFLACSAARPCPGTISAGSNDNGSKTRPCSTAEVVARTESGHRIIRRGDFMLRDNDDLFVPALWKSGVREIIADSRNGYAAARNWRLPPLGMTSKKSTPTISSPMAPDRDLGDPVRRPSDVDALSRRGGVARAGRGINSMIPGQPGLN